MENSNALPANTDEMTELASGALSQVTKEKKKKKKKKLTAKERALEKLEKEAEKFLKEIDACNDLYYFVAQWLKKKQDNVYKLLNQQSILTIDHETFKEQEKEKKEREKEIKEKSITDPKSLLEKLEASLQSNTSSAMDLKVNYDDFKTVVCDLGLACSDIEIYIICKLLDPSSTGLIDYRTFTPELLLSSIKHHYADGLKIIKKTEPTKHISSFTFKAINEQNFVQTPRYTKLDIKLIPFALEKDLKCHLRDEIVFTHVKIFSLIQLIKKKTEIKSNKIAIYRDNNRSKSSKLDENKTLEYYGFEGYNYNEAVNMGHVDKVVLYYDYSILDNNDPILNSDFYFNDFKKSF